MRNSYRTIGLWVILIILFLGFYQIFSGPTGVVHNVTWQTVQSAAEDGKIRSITVQLEGARGVGHVTLTDGALWRTDSRSPRDFAQLEQEGVEVIYDEKPSSLLSTILVQWLPIVFVFLFFVFFMRQLQGKGTKVLDFTVVAERVSQAPPLNGLREARARLKAIGDAARSGAAGPRKILLVGASGSGKTTLLKAAAADTGLPLLACAGSMFVEVFVGVGAGRIRTLFKRGTEEMPCLLAIDDLDAFATRRMLPTSPGVVDERAATMLELANQLDGLGKLPPKVVFIATTSRPDLLDEAIVRPGRFDLKIELKAGGECVVEELKLAA